MPTKEKAPTTISLFDHLWNASRRGIYMSHYDDSRGKMAALLFPGKNYDIIIKKVQSPKGKRSIDISFLTLNTLKFIDSYKVDPDIGIIGGETEGLVNNKIHAYSYTLRQEMAGVLHTNRGKNKFRQRLFAFVAERVREEIG